jgi:hypothetical protein
MGRCDVWGVREISIVTSAGGKGMGVDLDRNGGIGLCSL